MSVRFRQAFVMRLAALVLIALPLVLLVSCTRQQYPQSTLNPTSDFAWSVQHLFDQLLFWVVVIFVVVQGLLIFTVMRFRSRPGAPDPKPVHGSTFAEVAWTIAPSIIVVLLAVPTVLTIFETQTRPGKDALNVKVIGHQWWWEFQYPDIEVAVPDSPHPLSVGSELHVPVGRTVNVAIETADVLHSFWFPAIGGKRDAIPTHTNYISFKADSLGTFMGQCAELCGTSHANMRMRLVVETPEAFDAWVANQRTLAAEPESTSLAWQGKQAFTSLQCMACHTIDGVSSGPLGPNLTHVATRSGIAGDIFPNDAEHLARWISEAPKQKPGSLMPNMLEAGLTREQVPAVVAYLQSLK